MNQENPAEEIIARVQGNAGFITLNRPKALNALSLEMIRTLSSVLKKWEHDHNIQTVFIKGAGERAFCAGGDVKAFFRAGMEYRRGHVSLKVSALYFAEEYSLNKQIFHYTKPIVAFMNGITMGGGYGIAGHCKYRVATASTVFAMPETKIGFFPDVGSVYHLLKTPSHIGVYLALTGNSIGAADMIAAQLAEYHVAPEHEAKLTRALSDGESPEIALKSLHTKPAGDSPVFEKRAHSEAVFGAGELPAILAALKKDNSAWATETLWTLQARSPSSVTVTAAHLHRSKGQSFDQIIATDFTLAQRFLQGFDFYEGIRAVIIEKDNKPGWNPAELSGVSETAVKEYFSPTGHDLNDVQIFAA